MLAQVIRIFIVISDTESVTLTGRSLADLCLGLPVLCLQVLHGPDLPGQVFGAGDLHCGSGIDSGRLCYLGSSPE